MGCGSFWNEPTLLDGHLILPGFDEHNEAREAARQVASEWASTFNLNADWLTNTAVETLATWAGYRQLDQTPERTTYTPPLAILAAAQFSPSTPGSAVPLFEPRSSMDDYRRLPQPPGEVRAEWLNLGGGIETIYNAAAIVELAAEKGATSVLMPVSTRRDAANVADDIAAKVDVRFYADARDAFMKAIAD